MKGRSGVKMAISGALMVVNSPMMGAKGANMGDNMVPRVVSVTGSRFAM